MLTNTTNNNTLIQTNNENKQYTQKAPIMNPKVIKLIKNVRSTNVQSNGV